uniref:Transposase n=1 Tax=Panagrellus redivivus TaxID=6233 RepID=A0A7E4W4K9_PANRE
MTILAQGRKRVAAVFKQKVDRYARRTGIFTSSLMKKQSKRRDGLQEEAMSYLARDRWAKYGKKSGTSKLKCKGMLAKWKVEFAEGLGYFQLAMDK